MKTRLESKLKERVNAGSTVPLVLAAGGIVCRSGPAGLIEIAVVHRPGYDDWSLPKGKLDPGESLQEAALREVREETGMDCRLVRPYGMTSYVDRKGRSKTASYWIMRVVGGLFQPSDEVDQLRWLTVEEAVEVLSYDRDRDLLREGELR